MLGKTYKNKAIWIGTNISRNLDRKVGDDDNDNDIDTYLWANIKSEGYLSLVQSMLRSLITNVFQLDHH